MAEEEKMIPIGETHETPQAITITIMDPSALGTPNIASSIVTSVEPQKTTGSSTSGNCNLLMVSSSGEQEPKSSILQTVTETHMGTEELPIISSISNPDHDESAELETKISQTLEGMEGEMAQEGPNEPVGQHCLICNIDIEPNEVEEDEEEQQQVPVFKSLTTSTNRRISIFLGGLVGQKLTSRKAHSDIMCRRCFNLLDRVDSLEVEIKETKEEIVNKYQETLTVHGGRARRKKPSTARKSEYVFPKVEPEDEDDQMLGLETDGTFEPRLEDLIEEEHDRREDVNPDDDEWEPEFKRTRIKREIDMDSGVPPKRKRGRPRKDATRPKVLISDGGEAREVVLRPTRRVVTIPSTFRKCPHCPTIFLDRTKLEQHLSKTHINQREERRCHTCLQLFDTYEDHTACDTCLQSLQENAQPGILTDHIAGVKMVGEVQCGHCHVNFKSASLAQLHCLTTGHSPDLIINTFTGDMQNCQDIETCLKKETQETSNPFPKNSSSANVTKLSSSSLRSTATSSRGRQGRKRCLIRNNQTLCDTCGEECGSVSGLYAHLHAQHPTLFPHQCKVCGRGFSQEAVAREHERRHAVGELQCPACPLRFSRLYHLHQHARTCHPNFNKYPCQYCGTVTPTVDALHSHIKVHHGDKLGLTSTFTCNICNQSFYTGKALACHKTSRHPGTVECKWCNAKVGRRYLNKHINAVHTKEKVHKCEHCNKEFYSRTSLTGHQKRHYGPRRHLCHLCGKGYVHNVDLQRHLKVHRNQRDFKCDFCSLSFLKAVELTYHRRSHTGERPHTCHLCPEAFMKPLGLRRHLLKHVDTGNNKRLKYSKKKIEELASSVKHDDREEEEEENEKDEEEDETRESHQVDEESNVLKLGPSPTEDLPVTPHLQVFQDSPVAVPSLTQSQSHSQPDLQQLSSSDLHVQQLAVSDLDSGQLELSQVVENLDSGELLEMGPDLLLESEVEGTDGGRGVSEGVGCESGDRSVAQQTQSVEVIYVHLVEEAAGWNAEPPL